VSFPCNLRRRPSPSLCWVGSHITCFEACSAFTHVTACLLAEPPHAVLCIEGFDSVVTSTTAPIATGWNDSCRVGIAPTEDRRLSRRTKGTSYISHWLTPLSTMSLFLASSLPAGRIENPSYGPSGPGRRALPTGPLPSLQPGNSAEGLGAFLLAPWVNFNRPGARSEELLSWSLEPSGSISRISPPALEAWHENAAGLALRDGMAERAATPTVPRKVLPQGKSANGSPIFVDLQGSQGRQEPGSGLVDEMLLNQMIDGFLH
jgi:hypothetical protein